VVCKAENLREIRNFVGLVFQNPDNQLFMPTVWEDIAFGPMNLALRPRAERASSQAMAAVEIDPEWYGQRNTDNLSGEKRNELQRVY